LYKARKEYFEQQLRYAQLGIPALQAVIRRDVKTAYYELWFLQEKSMLFHRLDSIYTSLFAAADLRVRTGEAAGLERIAANTKQQENRAMMQQNIQEMLVQQRQLMMLLNTNAILLADDRPLDKMDLRLAVSDSLHPLLILQRQNVQVAASNVSIQKNTNKPEFSGRFFTQRVWGAPDPYSGFSVTAAFPLFGVVAYRNKVKAAEAETTVQQRQFAYQAQQLSVQKSKSLADIEKSLSMLKFYESSGLQQSDQIIQAATLSYRSGEISFAELSQFIGQAIETKRNYLQALNQYNQSVIQFDYYNNN
jgi:cobalt-zinc-cadmium resistance protein CzcA